MGQPPLTRPRQRSSDDLAQLDALEAAEKRARDAVRLAEEERRRRGAVEAELERQRKEEQARRQRELDEAIEASKSPPSKPPSSSAGLTYHGKGFKVAIPMTVVMAIAPLIWALVQDYLELKRQVKAQGDLIGTYEKRFEGYELKMSALQQDQTSLRTTVSEISGYLAGVLPKAGVRVPAAAPGAAQMDVESDPLPVGARRPTPVNVRTPVPAPSPPKAR